jgi:hypothetical protein
MQSYEDHENGIETVIRNSKITSIGVGILSRIENSKIVPNPSGKYSRVFFHMCNVPNLATGEILNSVFTPSDGTYASLIGIYCSPRETAYGENYYFGSLVVRGCSNSIPTRTVPIKRTISSYITGNIVIDSVTVIDSNFPITAEPKQITIIN